MGPNLERLGKLAGEGLISHDECDLENLGLGKVALEAVEADVRDGAIIASNLGGILEGSLFPFTKVRAPLERRKCGKLLLGDPNLHADGVADIRSVRAPVESRHVNVQKGPERGANLPKPLY